MNELDLNFYTVIISIASLVASIVACYQTSKSVKLSNRAMVTMYLVSSKRGTYVKVKNNGNFSAVLLSFETDVDVAKCKVTDSTPFPLVGLKNMQLAPKTSKIAYIQKKYLNTGHWLKVKYRDDLTNKEFIFKLDLNTYKEYALVNEEDFNLVDY